MYAGFLQSRQITEKFGRFPVYKSLEKIVGLCSMEKENKFLDLIFWHVFL